MTIRLLAHAIGRCVPTTALALATMAAAAGAQRGTPVPIQPARPVAPVATAYPPANLSVTGTPALARVAWQPAAGATGYSVERWKQSDPACCRAQSGVLSATTLAWSDPVQWSGAWVYRVTALYASGAQAFADASYVYPEPRVPTGFTATQTGDGTVTLTWQAVPDASWYVLSGPPTNSAMRVDGTSAVITGVSAGSQRWQVGSIYEVDAKTRAGSAFAIASLDVVRPVSGKYLITLTGARAISASFDDQLSRDGMGDEVYAAAYVRRYDRRSGGVSEFFERRTLTYGDIANFGTARVQAGSRGPSGGIRDGDPIPAGSDPSIRSAAPSNIAFPLRLWEGTLTEGVDALVISLSLWEEDGVTQQYLNWSQQMSSITPSLFARPEIQNQIAGARFGQMIFGASLMADGTADIAHFAVSLFSGVSMVGQQAMDALSAGHDRGIGILRSGVNDLVLPNMMVVLTRESIEAGLAPLPAGTTPVALPIAWPRMPRPGVIMVPLIDGKHYIGVVAVTPARYELYVTVERIP